MPTDISEKGLETILVEYLRDKQGYEQGVSDDYKKQYGVDTERVKRFILSTQKEKTVTTGCFANDNEERKFFTRLSAELTKRGVSDVLRKGFRYISELFDMYYPLPSELNPTAKKYYEKNIFCVTRQLFYSANNTDSIDVMLSLNGLPHHDYGTKEPLYRPDHRKRHQAISERPQPQGRHIGTLADEETLCRSLCR